MGFTDTSVLIQSQGPERGSNLMFHSQSITPIFLDVQAIATELMSLGLT